MIEKNHQKTICFIHYGIGWKDGVNTVLAALAEEIQRQDPFLNICFLGGEVKKRFVKGADYKTVPELIPRKRKAKLTKRQLSKESLIIAEKIAKATIGMDVIVIENPLLGTYHLSAMMGFSLYARKYKPKGTKLFFRVHDLYSDAPQYFKNLEKLFSPQEIRDLVKGRGVDGFLVVDPAVRTNLVKVRVPRKKIVYLPNGVNSAVFKDKLTKSQSQLLYNSLKIPKRNKKKPKILVYPVRVVPRKNVEEAILLIHFIREITGDNYILVVSGKVDENDRLSRSYYRALKELKAVARFPIIFKKGSLPSERKYGPRKKIKEFSIIDLYHLSSAIIMTSLREGFGYPFLECWFAKKLIIGRRTPNVISTFEKYGLKFQWLYRSFLIPEKEAAKKEEPAKTEAQKYFEKIGSRVKWLYQSFLVAEKFFLRTEKQEHLERTRKIIDILKDPELKKEALNLNSVAILRQVRVLQNKERQKQIIKANLKTARQIYEIKKTTKQFLKLLDL